MKVIVKNLAIEYRDEGAGKVLLFLHGWQDDLQTFDSLMPFLSAKNRVIRLDLPGFGASEMSKETWCLDDYVNFVAAFLKKLNIKVDVIIGHSFGGRVAIKGLATKTLKADKMILIGAAGIAKIANLRNSILKVVAKIAGLISYIPPLFFWRRQLRCKFYEFIGSDYLDAGVLKETFLKIISEDLKVFAEEIKLPTLLIWGSDDRETPLSDGRQFAKLISGSHLEVISAAGHFVHKEKPQEVAKLIQDFYD